MIVTVGARGQEGADRPNMLMEPEDRAALDTAIQAAEEKEIFLTLKKEDFACYDCWLGKWAAEPGELLLLVGNSSADIFQTVSVEIFCENPYIIGPQTDVVKVVSNPRAVQIVEKVADIKLRDVAGSYIVFQPLTPFERIWQEWLRQPIIIHCLSVKEIQDWLGHSEFATTAKFYAHLNVKAKFRVARKMEQGLGL